MPYKMRRVRVETSDDFRTRIIDVETGLEIPKVRKVVFTHEVGHAPTVELELVCAESAVVGYSTPDADFRDVTSHSSPGMFREWIKVSRPWWKRIAWWKPPQEPREIADATDIEQGGA